MEHSIAGELGFVELLGTTERSYLALTNALVFFMCIEYNREPIHDFSDHDF